MDSKRRSIKGRILGIVLLISAIAIAFTNGMGLISMLSIKSVSKSTLIDRMEQNLSSMVTGKAELVDSELEKYSDYVRGFAVFINELYKNPDKYVATQMQGPIKEKAGTYSLQKNVVSSDIKEEDIERESYLLANVEQIFYPVISGNEEVILSIYAATEKGLTFSYDKQSDVKPTTPYNAYDRPWYKLAKEKGGLVFSDVYMDSFGRGLAITCASPFYDESDKFAGVVAMGILITDLYNSVVAMELDGGDESYAFLVDSVGNIISSDGLEKSIMDDVEMDQATADKIGDNVTGVSLSKGTTYYAYAPVKSTSWRLCLHVPISVVLEPVRKMEIGILYTIIGFLVLLLIIIMVVYISVHIFADKITRPLISLGEDARIISNGNLEHRAVVTVNDEIGDLANEFNAMSKALKKYIEDLTRVTKEKERIDAELNVATQIQANMLPGVFPPFPERKEFDLYATMDPAKEVGGDFYDFFMADKDHLVIVMADVSGKGVPAALFMVTAKTLIKNRVQMGGTPSEILEAVNNQLCEGNEANLFVTVWLGILEVSTGKIVSCNAGHENPALRRKNGDFELVVNRHSPALAIMENMGFREVEFEISPGDRLYLYTDGVPEATSVDNKLFGTERMLASLNKNKDAPLKEILIEMKRDIDGFVGEAPQFDDITMLVFDYYGSC